MLNIYMRIIQYITESMTVVCIYMTEEFREKARRVAQALGYRSFSAFVNDLAAQAVTAYEVGLRMRKLSSTVQARDSILKSIVAKILSEMKA